MREHGHYLRDCSRLHPCRAVLARHGTPASERVVGPSNSNQLNSIGNYRSCRPNMEPLVKACVDYSFTELLQRLVFFGPPSALEILQKGLFWKFENKPLTKKPSYI